jgi:outer membrane lipoprotein-sorting protein
VRALTLHWVTGGVLRIRERTKLWWTEGPLGRQGARRRYATMLVIVAILASLPAVIGALPVSSKSESVATLLARIKASASIPYSGLASSSGQLELPPNLGVGQDTNALLLGTNRLRTWWISPSSFRVDRVTPVGESDAYRDGSGLWTYDSSSAVAQFSRSAPQFPLPGAEDALPPNLARRFLAEAPVGEVKFAGARRITGRTALGLVWTPTDKRSTIGRVTVWADEKTGLPLVAEARAVGGQSRAYSSSFLDFSTKVPTKAQVTFRPSSDQSAGIETTAPGPVDNNGPNFILPATLGGLKQRSPLRPLVATYGEGVSIVAVFDAGDPQTARQIREQIDSASRPPISGAFGRGSLITTPLLTGLVFATRDSGYILIGTVNQAELEAMALELRNNPPKRAGANTVKGGNG